MAIEEVAVSCLSWALGLSAAWYGFFLLMGVVFWCICKARGKRVHWYEFHDTDYCPKFLQKTCRMYLRFGWDGFGNGSTVGSCSRSLGPFLFESLSQSGWIYRDGKTQGSANIRMMDLCSGGGGPTITVHQTMEKLINEAGIVDCDISSVLTDLFPQISLWRQFTDRYPDLNLSYCSDPVNALNVDNQDLVDTPQNIGHTDPNAKGNRKKNLTIRTVYASFHHFVPHQAVELIADAIYNGHGFLMVEPVTGRKFWYFIRIALMVLVPVPMAIVALCNEFLIDKSVSLADRLLNCILFVLTLPLSLTILVHDGIVSCARTYTVSELEDFAKLAKISAQKRLDKGGLANQVHLKEYNFEITDSYLADLTVCQELIGDMLILFALPQRK